MLGAELPPAGDAFRPQRGRFTLLQDLLDWEAGNREAGNDFGAVIRRFGGTQGWQINRRGLRRGRWPPCRGGIAPVVAGVFCQGTRVPTPAVNAMRALAGPVPASPRSSRREPGSREVGNDFRSVSRPGSFGLRGCRETQPRPGRERCTAETWHARAAQGLPGRELGSRERFPGPALVLPGPLSVPGGKPGTQVLVGPPVAVSRRLAGRLPSVPDAPARRPRTLRPPARSSRPAIRPTASPGPSPRPALRAPAGPGPNRQGDAYRCRERPPGARGDARKPRSRRCGCRAYLPSAARAMAALSIGKRSSSSWRVDAKASVRSVSRPRASRRKVATRRLARPLALTTPPMTTRPRA